MRKWMIAGALVGMLASPALASECVFDNGVGPTLKVIGEREALEVNFGDWTETCPITFAPPRPDLGLGAGWFPAHVATCDNWAAQVTFVEPQKGSGDFSIVVFDGMPFYSTCKEAGL